MPNVLRWPAAVALATTPFLFCAVGVVIADKLAPGMAAPQQSSHIQTMAKSDHAVYPVNARLDSALRGPQVPASPNRSVKAVLSTAKHSNP
jgi:hypothetical protein